MSSPRARSAPPTTPEGLAALARRRFGAQGDAIAAIYGDRRSKCDRRAGSNAKRLPVGRLGPAGPGVRQTGKARLRLPLHRLAPGPDPIKVGAFHSAELAYVFATQASFNRPWQSRDRELALQLQLFWTNFAKTGDPNGEGLPAWPRFDAASEAVMELGDVTRPIGVLDAPRKALFDAYLSTRLP